MKLILLIAAYLLIPVALRAWLAHCLSSYKTHESRVSYRPYILIIGVADAAVFLTIATAATVMDQFSWFVVLVSLLFVALGVFVITCYFNLRIHFDEYSFTVSSFWGKKRTYTYGEITGVHDDGHAAHTLYCDKRRVEVAYIASGSREFMTMAQRQYKRLHGGANIPKLPRKKDPFNGHIRNPWEFVVVYSVLFVLTLVMLVLFSVFILQTYDETNTLRMECCFTSCSLKEQELVFISQEGDIYKMEFVPEDYPTGKLNALCDGQTQLEVYVRNVTPEDEDPYYGIEQIRVGDTVVLSFEENWKYHWQMNGRVALITITCIVILCWLMIAFSFIVGRNPKKYPRWVVHLFFKKGYVIYDE